MRVLEEAMMTMSEIILSAAEPYWSSEMDYRRERLNRDWVKRPRRHRVAALPPLRLPRPRRRPVAVS
jgi:hypothetical protein